MREFELVKQHFTFPFEPHDFQEESLGEMVPRDCSLITYDVGYGKTMAATMAALYYSIEDDVEQVLVLCPPILIDQWYEFLIQIKGIPSIGVYRGTPDERKEMDMEESVVIASYNIFRGKRDYSRFKKLALNTKLCVIADELSLKSLKSQTYRKIKEILYRKMRVKLGDIPHHKLVALNATPISELDQVYNWCSLFVPGVYGSKKLFELSHVTEYDHWKKPKAWKDEDVLQRNMDLFIVDTDAEIKLPPLVETVVPYHLAPEHMKLYKEVLEAELDALPEEKIDLFIDSMFSSLQRLILIPEEFGLPVTSPVLEFLEGFFDQVSPDAGVLIYTRHKLVSKFIHENIPDSVAIYGDVPKAKKIKALEDIKSGRKKRCVGNIDSLGVGLNLQMIQYTIYIEFPFRDDKLTQATGRTHRQGQKNTCFTYFPVAKDTLQTRIYNRLIQNGEDIAKVIRTKKQMREFLC